MSEISRQVWELRYRRREQEPTVEATWRRVAHALASVERKDRERWAGRFYEVLEGFKFLPGGRILAGAGVPQRLTLMNCFVMGTLGDSLDGIFEGLKEGALTMQQGGGVGYDFSPLRPRGAAADQSNTVASGPVSFMRIWDSMCATIQSTGARRGAMMATLRCDHPDIETFISAKQQRGQLEHFNLSVLATDAFMEAVRSGEDWPLVFPLPEGDPGGSVEHDWLGRRRPCRIVRRLPARELWEAIMRAAYQTGDPGVVFIDRVNRSNNLSYCEYIAATNPCGEVPLPPYGACDLGSVNLTQFVRQPFTSRASLDMEGIRRVAGAAVRMLDNAYEVTRFPLTKQAESSRRARRLGLGLTGLADALAMLGLRYGTQPAAATAAEVMRTVCHAAYSASVELAKEKGTFPAYQREPYDRAEFVSALPSELREAIHRWGIRNSHLTAIAPTGTISLFAGNVSSGVEPIYDLRFQRKVRGLDRDYLLEVTDYAVEQFERLHPEPGHPLPEAFVTAGQVSPAEQLRMQASLQPYVDNAISKTVNVPEDCSFESFRDVFQQAYALGLKGCTAFRAHADRPGILERR